MSQDAGVAAQRLGTPATNHGSGPAHADARVNGDGAPASEPRRERAPATPPGAGLPPSSSQLTMPSTETPSSPIGASPSFKTEGSDDRSTTAVIPSSLTPPPSTQVAPAAVKSRRAYSYSRPPVFFSPPATIPVTLRAREVSPEYVPPTSSQLHSASIRDLRGMLRACIAQQKKLKIDAAHHRLQYNLLRLQAEDDSKRAAVEHNMVRREVEALRLAEHTREAKRELGAASDPLQTKYQQVKVSHEEAVREVDVLRHRLQLAKKIIQRKEEETIDLVEERDLLLTRIHENREHFRTLCSPGGIFHNAMTSPKPTAVSTPRQQRALTQPTPTPARHVEREPSEHGLSALLQAMSQDNTSEPTTPLPSHRPAHHHVGRHNRNAQSMSSFPTTPVNRSGNRNGGLLPSAHLVSQTEPRRRHALPETPTPRRDRRQKSRESTISVEDTEELARQAFESAAAAAAAAAASTSPTDYQYSYASLRPDTPHRRDGADDLFRVQNKPLAVEMLRHRPVEGYDVSRWVGAHNATSGPAQSSARMQARLLSSPPPTANLAKKRQLSGIVEPRTREQSLGSPVKRVRLDDPPEDDGRRFGLGIH